MTARHHLEDRTHMEAILAQRADDLLRLRARKTGMKPSALLRTAIPEVDDEKNGIVQTLLARLAERDG